MSSPVGSVNVGNGEVNGSRRYHPRWTHDAKLKIGRSRSSQFACRLADQMSAVVPTLSAPLALVSGHKRVARLARSSLARCRLRRMFPPGYGNFDGDQHRQLTASQGIDSEYGHARVAVLRLSGIEESAKQTVVCSASTSGQCSAGRVTAAFAEPYGSEVRYAAESVVL